MTKTIALLSRAKRSHSAQATARRRAVDCTNHSLSVYSGQDRLGSIVERDGVFRAYSVTGDLTGVFPTMITAARSLSTVEGSR
jgi:hypothetical protein